MGICWPLARLWARWMLRGNHVITHGLPSPPTGGAIIIANHASFYDWHLVAGALGTDRLHVVMTRYFFSNPLFSAVLRKSGCIPKSVFVEDKGSAIEMIRVLKKGGLLLLFPEARLGALSRTETIPEETARFIKRIGYPLYGVHIDGASLVSPKWGSIRRGGTIEVKARKLAEGKELSSMSETEVRDFVGSFLSYDDYAWLERHPELHYRSRCGAEGVRNVLWKCPSCGKEGTLTAEGDTIRCSCGFSATIDDRYRLSSCFPTVQSALEWCVSSLKKEMASPDWKMEGNCALTVITGHGKKPEQGRLSLDHSGLAYQGDTFVSVPREELVLLPFSAGKNFVLFRNGACFVFVPERVVLVAKWSYAGLLLGATSATFQTR